MLASTSNSQAKEYGLISSEGLRNVVASAIDDVHQLLAKARQQKPTWWLATKKEEWCVAGAVRFLVLRALLCVHTT